LGLGPIVHINIVFWRSVPWKEALKKILYGFCLGAFAGYVLCAFAEYAECVSCQIRGMKPSAFIEYMSWSTFSNRFSASILASRKCRLKFCTFAEDLERNCADTLCTQNDTATIL
jgi:hypothetical protein